MTIGKVIITAAVLAIAAPVTAAMAHENDYYTRHDRDHQEHWRYHGKIDDEHARAHEDGFDSRGEHRAYHRYLKERHDDFHDDHPGTRHDHYQWYRPWYRWWNRD